MIKKHLRGVAFAASLFYCVNLPVSAAGYVEVGQYGRPAYLAVNEDDEDIAEEIYYDELELLAQLVEAEAGNQPFEGKCLVADVILNRVESDEFPDTISEVIFQDGQFSVVKNGALDKAGYNMKEDDYAAVMCEVELHSNRDVLYFNNCSKVSGSGEKFKVGGHWFRNG